MIKYASNAALATMISFANEFGRLCSTLGDVDVRDVMHGVHASTYFTTRLPDGTPVKAAITSFLEAGCGYGGSCLPKDVTALVAQGRDHGLPMSMLASVLEINAGQPAEVLRLVHKHVPDLAGGSRRGAGHRVQARHGRCARVAGFPGHPPAAPARRGSVGL